MKRRREVLCCDNRIYYGYGDFVSSSFYIHMRGTASDVSGIFSVTMFRKTVSESRMVTPEKEEFNTSKATKRHASV